MRLKSETTSNVLKMLLWALVALAAVDLAFSAIYAIDLDVFSDYIYPFYGFVDIVSVVLYYIIVVIYLIWIYRVHVDMKRLFLQYPRSPGASLACNMIPFYNLYGIPSTYRLIGSSLQQGSAIPQRQGRWVSGLAVPLLIMIYATNILNRVVASADEVSGSLLLITSGCTLVLYIIFLVLTIQVSGGLSVLHAETADNASELERSDLTG